eukprot:3932635-Rhodomonas_salina.1
MLTDALALDFQTLEEYLALTSCADSIWEASQRHLHNGPHMFAGVEDELRTRIVPQGLYFFDPTGAPYPATELPFA